MEDLEASELMRTKVVINISNILHQLDNNYHDCSFKMPMKLKLFDLLEWLNNQVEAKTK